MDLSLVEKNSGQGFKIQFLEPSKSSHRWFNSILNYFFGSQLGLQEYGEIIQKIKQDDSEDHIFVKYQKAFGSQYHLTEGSFTNIPKTGPLIIVANHPGAGWEIFSIVELVLQTRSDFKILANEVLASIPGLSDSFIPVSIFKKKANQALVQAKEHLKNQGVLIVFPSGEVSSHIIGYKNSDEPIIVDGPWMSALILTIKSTLPDIVPIYVDSRPTDNWLKAREDIKSDTLRVLKLFGSEVFSHKGENLPLTLGRSISADVYIERVGLKNLFPTLRRATYLLGGIELPDYIPNQESLNKEKNIETNRQGAKLWLP
ncbi:MAG: 1-acyl-sn-glycerol-3-phosphate acyltransferase [Bdellovibrionaceae bacterium]|nr:1-acyl-sn-glycerol-3-phosphate acyltransferase [Pseudobdellovibrionaceae bacterium]